MNTKRIEAIQKETAYPDSISVQQALLKVWNECEQEKAVKNNAVLPHVSNWVAVTDRLPVEAKHRMSSDVLTIAGNKMSVKCYDYELGCWTGSPHITVKYWMELPKPPCC